MSASVIQRGLRRALRHPVMVAAREPIKDAWWRARGRGISNPEMPSAVRSILFVCKGNICRSPFAAMRAAQLFDQAGLRGVRCASAGIATTQAARPPLEACVAASAFGLSLDAHRPMQMTPELLSTHDVVVVMDAEQMLSIRRAHPETANRVFLLSLLDTGAGAGYARYNISDPFGQPVPTFGHCYWRIDGALRSLLGLVIERLSQPRSRGPMAQPGAL
jgi:protein-tyrosine phosphatase